MDFVVWIWSTKINPQKSCKTWQLIVITARSLYSYCTCLFRDTYLTTRWLSLSIGNPFLLLHDFSRQDFSVASEACSVAVWSLSKVLLASSVWTFCKYLHHTQSQHNTARNASSSMNYKIRQDHWTQEFTCCEMIPRILPAKFNTLTKLPFCQTMNDEI